MYPFGYYHLFHPSPRYAWHKVRILHETEKAILVTAPFVIASEAKPACLILVPVQSGRQSQNDNIKIWIPKSQIGGIRLIKGIFEIYAREGTAG